MATLNFQPQERDRPPFFRHENRNRPHPNKSFLYWKQPRRYLESRHSCAFRNDVHESFYQDYSSKPAINIPSYGDSDETYSIQVNPWRRGEPEQFYKGFALDPIRAATPRVINNNTDHAYNIITTRTITPQFASDERMRLMDQRRTPTWSANLLQEAANMKRATSRQLQSSRLSTARPQTRLSVINSEEVPSGAKLPPEVKDLTKLINDSDKSQRAYLLDYLRSLTNILEDQVLDTTTHVNPLKTLTRAAPAKPNFSYQSQPRLMDRSLINQTHPFRHAPPTAMVDANVTGLKFPQWPNIS